MRRFTDKFAGAVSRRSFSGMSRPLRIAMFLGTFPVVSETFILRQITGLLDLGCQVDIYADNRSNVDTPQHPQIAEYKLLERTTFMDAPPECVPWELPVWPIRGKTWIPGASQPVSNLARLARACPIFLRCFSAKPRLAIDAVRTVEFGFQAESLSILYRLHRLLGKHASYDVLHAHFGPNGNTFRFVSKLWGAPLVVSFHGYDFCTAPRQQGQGMYEKLFNIAAAVTGNSDFTVGQLGKLGCPAEKLQKLPVGLNLEEFAFQERTRKTDEPVRILSIGRLVEIKGHVFSLQGIAALCRDHPNIQYDIVGDGPLRSTLESKIKALGLEGHVTLHGALAGNRLKQVRDSAHLFMLTSINVDGDQEGQGLALQEAQAAGLPVIATENGGLPEGLLPGKSGFLVKENDVHELCQRLTYLVEHPEIWPKMGRAGRDFVSARYDIKKLNLQLIEIYETAMEEYRRGNNN